MSSEILFPVPTGTIDVKALVKELDLPHNKIINTDTPWWSITTEKGETYFIPSQPVLYGVSHKTLQDKSQSREITQGGVRYTCVELPVETVRRWLSYPELRKDTSASVSPLGRVCWMGADKPKRNSSYTNVLHVDTGTADRVFHLTHTSQMGWLPVLQVQTSLPVIESSEEVIHLPIPSNGLSLTGELQFSLSLYYKDGSELIHTGSRDSITMILNNLNQAKGGVIPESIQCKVVGYKQSYSKQTSLEDLLKGK